MHNNATLVQFKLSQEQIAVLEKMRLPGMSRHQTAKHLVLTHFDPEAADLMRDRALAGRDRLTDPSDSPNWVH